MDSQTPPTSPHLRLKKVLKIGHIIHLMQLHWAFCSFLGHTLLASHFPFLSEFTSFFHYLMFLSLPSTLVNPFIIFINFEANHAVYDMTLHRIYVLTQDGCQKKKKIHFILPQYIEKERVNHTTSMIPCREERRK